MGPPKSQPAQRAVSPVSSDRASFARPAMHKAAIDEVSSFAIPTAPPLLRDLSSGSGRVVLSTLKEGAALDQKPIAERQSLDQPQSQQYGNIKPTNSRLPVPHSKPRPTSYHPGMMTSSTTYDLQKFSSPPARERTNSIRLEMNGAASGESSNAQSPVPPTRREFVRSGSYIDTAILNPISSSTHADGEIVRPSSPPQHLEFLAANASAPEPATADIARPATSDTRSVSASITSRPQSENLSKVKSHHRKTTSSLSGFQDRFLSKLWISDKTPQDHLATSPSTTGSKIPVSSSRHQRLSLFGLPKSTSTASRLSDLSSPQKPEPSNKNGFIPRSSTMASLSLSGRKGSTTAARQSKALSRTDEEERNSLHTIDTLPSQYSSSNVASTSPSGPAKRVMDFLRRRTGRSASSRSTITNPAAH